MFPSASRSLSTTTSTQRPHAVVVLNSIFVPAAASARISCTGQYERGKCDFILRNTHFNLSPSQITVGPCEAGRAASLHLQWNSILHRI
ncbi:hypothetical protein B0H15DRAFT_955432 [Mycena belliarum]|uniref:Uncharacterized protein n=1 Tax=Mycena belliarum TaxID=1033014 RepID=A0AAD6XG68_9AGAR|nr:hypothetical protein B0H15DRAFT_955432 [Mycena belliae]